MGDVEPGDELVPELRTAIHHQRDDVPRLNPELGERVCRLVHRFVELSVTVLTVFEPKAGVTWLTPGVTLEHEAWRDGDARAQLVPNAIGGLREELDKPPVRLSIHDELPGILEHDLRIKQLSFRSVKEPR